MFWFFAIQTIIPIEALANEEFGKTEDELLLLPVDIQLDTSEEDDNFIPFNNNSNDNDYYLERSDHGQRGEHHRHKNDHYKFSRHKHHKKKRDHTPPGATTTPPMDGPDTTSPSQPMVVDSSHALNATSTEMTIWVSWSTSTDPVIEGQVNSGLSGYSFIWDNTDNTDPDNAIEETSSTSNSVVLDQGAWFFHLKAIDNAENFSSTTHWGPIMIEATPTPTPPDSGTTTPPTNPDPEDTANPDNPPVGDGPASFSVAAASGSGHRRQPAVLAAFTGPESGPVICPTYLNGFIKFGGDNNPEEVFKLQRFLRDFEGHSLEETGIYDIPTFEAVKSFQVKYQEDILDPWGITDPTGYVYITTSLAINRRHCGLSTRTSLDLRLASALLDQVANKDSAGASVPKTNPSLAPESSGQGLAVNAEENDNQSSSLFGSAALGLTEFIKGYPWWWWLLVVVVLIVAARHLVADLTKRTPRTGVPQKDEVIPMPPPRRTVPKKDEGVDSQREIGEAGNDDNFQDRRS